MNNVIDLRSYKLNNNKNKIICDMNALIEGKNKIYMLIGIPCSGKSTYASFLKSNKPGIVVVSSDEIRKELTGTYVFTSKSNEIVFETAKLMINQALAKGLDVVFDATNTLRIYRGDIINIAEKYHSVIIAVVFKAPVSLCLKRNSKRSIERKIPENVILDMSRRDLEISKSEGFDEVIEIL